MKNLIPTGSAPGNIYGLNKVYKENNPARPVVSMINTPEYHLAKLLDSIIKPYIPDEYMLKSTDDFMNKLNEFWGDQNQVMVSFDVVSLFTNTTGRNYQHNCRIYFFRDSTNDSLPMPKDIFIKLMKLATQDMFQYKDKLYQQTDGVARGSSLEPKMANFFLAHFEYNIFQHDSPFLPKIYLRYVDDVLLSLIMIILVLNF